MNEYLNGFERKEVTFNTSASVKEGETVNLMSKSTLGLAIADSNFCGVCSSIRGKSASLVLKGYVTVSYSGTAPSIGYNKLAADGLGGVQVSESGRHILVADIDKGTLTCGIIL